MDKRGEGGQQNAKKKRRNFTTFITAQFVLCFDREIFGY